MDSLRERARELLRRAGLAHAPRGVVAAALAVAVLAVVAALWHWWPRANDTATFTAGGSPPGTAGSSFGGSSPSAEGAPSAQPGDSGTPEPSGTRVFAHVVGAVRHPGLYELPSGARVADAITAAGGLLGSAAEMAVNLARPVQDGEQIVVPTTDEYEASGAGGAATASGSTPGASAAGPAAGARVNINTADAALLDTLPGIGPSTAQKIVADRETNGRFSSVDDLGRVTGIGPKKLDALRDLISVN